MSIAAAHFRTAYERFLSGEPSSFPLLLDEGVTYHLPGNHLGGGTLRGRAEVLDRIRGAALACTAPPRVELIQVLAPGPFVVSIERIAATRVGATLAQALCVVWRFEGGRCVEIWAHFANQADCDGFWSGLTISAG
jgi:ketosteroid isomerase-like protein